jgi:hypothetical protein
VSVSIRLRGLPEEVATVLARLGEVLDVVAVLGPYPDRPPSRLVRVYVQVRL